mgnify:CR=1 FL=1
MPGRAASSSATLIAAMASSPLYWTIAERSGQNRSNSSSRGAACSQSRVRMSGSVNAIQTIRFMAASLCKHSESVREASASFAAASMIPISSLPFAPDLSLQSRLSPCGDETCNR